MAYFKIGNNDYSKYVNILKVNNNRVYNTQINANGDSVVDFINSKKTIEVGIIPLNDTVMAQLQNDIDQFNVSISFRNPKTNALEVADCIIPTDAVDYYTIQADKVSYKAFSLVFTEL